ncbi:MAG TPA: trypsin-like peptidase domain-containing protein [Gemmatimonadota bacterium]
MKADEDPRPTPAARAAATSRAGLSPARLAGLGALAGGVATAGLFLVLGGGRAAGPGPAGVAAAAQQTTPAAIDDSRRTAIVAAADRVGRSVVAIYARSTQQANPYAGTIWEDFFPFFRQPLPVQSLGSGFIYSAEGYVVTNHHVVADADSVHVTLMDGRSFPATIVGSDPTTDLAVLRIEGARGAPLPVAPLGTSADLLIGEWAIAIGNPFAPLLADANPSVTVGVISALHRDVRPEPGQEQVWTDMVQTDASINPGNSGGPLVNARGEVVGVNSFIFSRSGGSIGIGVAIPIDRVRRIADDLVRSGRVRLTWIGVHAQDVAAVDPADPVGVRVTVERVDPGSPAEKSGVRPGDGLLAANGRRVLSALDWQGRQLDFRAGDTVRLELVRTGASITLEVAAAPDPLAAAPESAAPLGLRLTALTPALRSYLGTAAESGLLVTAVAPGSPAQNIGLEQGDVILAIDNRRIASVDEGVALLRELSSRPRASLVWERRGQLFRWDG